jgi:hypothetical protein
MKPSSALPARGARPPALEASIGEVYDVNTLDDGAYMVMEHLAGSVLEEVGKRGPCSPQAVDYDAQACDASARRGAFAPGIIHRESQTGELVPDNAVSELRV